MGGFEIIGGAFARDGKEHRVLSGALHYFRVRPEQWSHRLRMLAAMGLNCVETYVPWNLHERRPGEFTDVEQLGEFLSRAADEGLDAIVRPGPYICAEWDNGGLPSWLTGRIRCSEPGYLAAVDAWFDVLIPLVAEHQITRGGNVIMVQVENEYGSYGTDLGYLRHLQDGLRRRGIDVPLFTSDGPNDLMLTGGTIPGVLATVNFGSEPEQAFKVLREIRPSDPLFCMEFWCGWFDHWGGEHVTRDAADAADVLRRILDAGASVNLYMAHGGTSFGTWSGANRGDPMRTGASKPHVSSYDYDAPVDERGAPTAKFWLFRSIFEGYQSKPLPDPPQLPPLLPPRQVPMTQTLALLDVMDGLPSVESPMPLSFEELGLEHGLALYRTALPGPRARYPLKITGLADRAQIFVDGAAVGEGETVAVQGERADVAVFVESMGRVNYGPLVGERKGITGGILHDQQYTHGFRTTPFAVDDISSLPWGHPRSGRFGPLLTRGWLDVDEPRDTFVGVPDGVKGYVWVNGFLLGRYWNVGPQERLYLPWPLLRRGRNEFVVLELDAQAVTSIGLHPTPHS